MTELRKTRKTLRLGALSVAALSLAALTKGIVIQAQTPSTGTGTGPASEAQRAYAVVKDNILKAADRMPAEAYTYKPTADIRTFARVVNHVAEAQLHACGLVNGTAAAAIPSVPSETAEKATIVQSLQASFAECDKAFASTTDSNMTEMIAAGSSKRSRIGLLFGTVSHDNEQYATLALYLRLKGLVLPSSEK